MAVLSRINISNSQRFDLEDLNGLLSDLRCDSKFLTKAVLSENNQIVSGFQVQGLGLNEATVLMTNAALLLSENTTDFSFFVAPDPATNIVVSDADLNDGARNFLEIQLQTLDGTPITKAFWDANANSGAGAEFSQIVNTVTDLRAIVTVLPGGFSSSPDAIPLAIIDVSPTGQIETIFDQRPIFGRLALPTNLNNEYAWGTKQEPPFSLTMSSVTGNFVAGETINIGTETATVVTGGAGPSITFNVPSGVNIFPGDSVAGVTSGATGTIVSLEESFTGVDKDLGSIGTILKAIQTEVKLIKGTDQWYQDAGATLQSVSAFGNSVLVQASVDGRFSWDGTNLTITDSNPTPGNSDVVAYLRQLGVGTDMALTRQSTGQEIQTITFSAVPDAGSLTLDHNGDVSLAINPSDDSAAVQTAVNATWAATVTVTGDFITGFVFTFDTPGDVALIAEQTNTFTSSLTPVTTTIVETQAGYTGGSVLPIGLDEVLFIDVPSVGGRTFSDLGVLNTNYQTVSRSAFVSSSTNYWIAYNQGGLLYLRGMGELQPGEDTPISDPDKETLLALINAQSQRANQDRGIKLTAGGTWSVMGNTLTNSDTANILIPGSPFDTNQIAAQSLTFPNVNSVAFVVVDRSSTTQSFRSPSVVDIENVPISDDVLIIARRTPDGILVGTNSFLLKDGEFLELDGALAEINRLLGQLEITTHETDADKVRISGSSIPQLDGSTLSQLVGQALMRFDGAVVNFTTGEIFEADGTTPLGVNFTPPSIPVGEFLWYGLSINTGNSNAINETIATVGVDISSSSSAVAANASLPSFCGGGVKRGWVQVQNSAGNIQVNNIKRLGASANTGLDQSSGIRDIYENRLDFSLFQTVSATVFAEDGASFIDPASTGALANSCFFRFSAASETLLDLNNATSTDFIAAEMDLVQVELFVRWDEDAIDPAATYELSRDGGNEYQTVSMVQVGTDSNAFRGFHLFSEEASDQNLEEQLTPNATRELTDTGLGVRRAVQIPISNPSVIKTISLDFNKIEAVAGNLDAGNYRIQLILDDAGNPSTNPNDIISESSLLSISTIPTGNSSVLVDLPNAIKANGSVIWAVITTDAAYKGAFNTGVDALSIRVNTTSPHHTGSAFDGLSWNPIAEAWTFQLNGRILDLRLRITSSTGNVRLESYGIYYHDQPGVVANTGAFDIDIFEFSGDDNVTNFPLVNIQDPIPGLVEAFDETEGNALLNGTSTYQILGNTLVFVPNYFNRPSQNLTLKVRQLKAGIIDNSDPNAAKIQANELAITDIRNNQDKFGIAGGVANVYTLTLSPPITSLIDGQIFSFAVPVSNTGPSTLDVDGTGPRPVGVNRFGLVSDFLALNDLRAGARVQVQYNANVDDFILISGSTEVAYRNSTNTYTVQQNMNAGLSVDGGIGIDVIPPGTGILHATGEIIADGGYRQPGSGGETLRIIRGRVNLSGGILTGSGFSSVRLSVGLYEITFDTGFTGIPAVVVTSSAIGAISTSTPVLTSNLVHVELRLSTTSTLADASFSFIAIGPA